MLPQTNIKILDANMILRLLLRDDESMADTAEEIIDNNEVFVTFEVVAEVVFVMLKVYKANRSHISEVLKDFINLDSVNVPDHNVLEKSLDIFGNNNLDFVDCILCAYSLCRGYEVCTFDVKLRKLIDKLKK